MSFIAMGGLSFIATGGLSFIATGGLSFIATGGDYISSLDSANYLSSAHLTDLLGKL